MEKVSAKHRDVPIAMYIGSFHIGVRDRSQPFVNMKQNAPERRTRHENVQVRQRHRVMRSP